MRLTAAAALLTLLGLASPVLAAEEAEKKPQKAAEHKVTHSESWVQVDDFYTTIVGDGRANGMLMVQVGLDVPDAKMRENVNRSMPVLRDAYLRSLMAYTSTHVRLDTAPDAVAITDRAMKKKGAKILLGQVALRAK